MDTNEDIECSYPEKKRVFGPSLPNNDGKKIEVGLRTFLEMILSPLEGLTSGGLYGRKRVQPEVASLLLQHPEHRNYAHVEVVTLDNGDTYYFVWDLHEWNNTNKNIKLKTISHEISRIKYLQKKERFERTLNAILEAEPRLKRDKFLANELVGLWISEPELYEKKLRRFNYYDGVEEFEELVAQLQQDFEEYKKNAKHYG